MQNLSLALRTRGEEGEALPSGNKRLADIGVHFRRGQLSLVAAAPGGGKSSLITHLVREMGAPTLYFSADGDTLTVGKSVLAGLLGIDQSDAELLLLNEDPKAYEILGDAIDHVWWCFDSSPSLQDINEELDAYAMVMGEWPHLVVIDNLMDIAEGAEEGARLTEMSMALKSMARFTGAHVCALAHVTGYYTDGTIPIPRSGIMYKIDKKPEMILTLYQPQPGWVHICVVKNRGGEARTDASFGIQIAWSPEMGWWGE